MEIIMTSPSSFLAAAIIVASASLTGLATAAPIPAPLNLANEAASMEIVFRGGNWGSNHPLMTGEGWNEQMRAWDAREGQPWGGANASADCRRFRSYDRRTGTYRGRDGRRHRCS
jgi:hypothetical protein